MLRRHTGWTERQGRTNAALFVLARDVHAEFVPPESDVAYGRVRGRTNGCAFELWVRDAPDRAELMLTLRHYHTQQTTLLDGDGCRPPRVDPDVVRAVIAARTDALTHTA